jgi:hypothetical protein
MTFRNLNTENQSKRDSPQRKGTLMTSNRENGPGRGTSENSDSGNNTREQVSPDGSQRQSQSGPGTSEQHSGPGWQSQRQSSGGGQQKQDDKSDKKR